MRQLTVLFVLAVVLFWHSATAAHCFDQNHELWTQCLKKYTQRGLVSYKQIKADPTDLNNYLDVLAKTKEEDYEKFNADQKKAFWVNAYNALTIKNVVDHYPIEGKIPWFPKNSIRQVDGFWTDCHFTVLGEDITLYTLMHTMIRSQFHDPRMHFAVVPAAKGAPPLPPAAYKGDTVEHDLDYLTRRVVSNKKYVYFDALKNQIRLSKIFSWFPVDFLINAESYKGKPLPLDNQIVCQWVLSLAPEKTNNKFSRSNPQIIFVPYDWSLNDTSPKGAK